MSKTRIFHSVREIKEVYTPRACEEERMKALMASPGEYGKYVASKLLEMIAEGLKNMKQGVKSNDTS